MIDSAAFINWTDRFPKAADFQPSCGTSESRCSGFRDEGDAMHATLFRFASCNMPSASCTVDRSMFLGAAMLCFAMRIECIISIMTNWLYLVQACEILSAVLEFLHFLSSFFASAAFSSLNWLHVWSHSSQIFEVQDFPVSKTSVHLVCTVLIQHCFCLCWQFRSECFTETGHYTTWRKQLWMCES